MPNQPPLNPDALAHSRSAAFDCWESGGNMDDLAECAIEAYLAVAQPVVNKVEELDALPSGSVILNDLGEAVSKYGDDWYFPGIQHRFTRVASLPAHVLYRPEVPDA